MEQPEQMKPHGTFTVFVHTKDGWKEAGSLTFDRFYREKTIDIRSYVSKSGQAQIRLVQKDGAAAHIDSVLLGGNPPVEVSGGAEGLKKLSCNDFDVIDAYKKSIDMTFSLPKENRILTLTARVESTSINKVPFQFPLDNLYRPMNERAVFYTYKFSAHADKKQPFFKEYSLSGSGHPSGYTYGWVSNDDKNLYVRIDFTPDNTMDGPKDYAKIYVKTTSRVREFKVSVPETKWGNADFTYTDKVPYQHKVYEFEIPLREIGITDASKADELKLAFAAYGTASPPGGDFNSQTGNYLIAYMVGGDLYGQFVNQNGTPFGAEFVISNAASSQDQASIAYNSTTNQYLVVWRDYRSGNGDIYGRLVNANGSFPGTDFIINAVTTNNQNNQSVTYNSTANQYLVVWDDDRSGDADIYGRLVNANESFPGTDFIINAVTTNNQRRPSSAYNSTDNQYFVVWEDNRSGTNYDIYGRLVNANQTFPGADFIINAVTTNNQELPSLAYNSSTNQFMVVWQDGRSGTNSDIYGRLMNANGTFPPGGDLPISTITENKYGPSLAYNPTSNQFLATWTDYRDGGVPDIYGQLLDANGALSGGDFLVNEDGYASKTIANTTYPNYLVAFWDSGNGRYSYVVVPHPSSIPAMDAWGMMVFMVIAGLGAVLYYMRRQRAIG